MPNATMRANAPAMPNRRATLGSLIAATAALALPSTAIAAAGSDARLFALIDEGKHWLAQMETLCGLCDTVRAMDEGREVTKDDEAKLAEAQDKYCEALSAAVECAPQTVGGFRALLEWIGRDGEGGFDDDLLEVFITSALASPILRAEA